MNILSEWVSRSSSFFSGLFSRHFGWSVLFALSCYSIALAFFYYAYKRHELRVRTIVFPLSLFIFICGSLYLLPVGDLGQLHNWLNGSLEMIAVIGIIGAGILLWPLVLAAIKIPQQTTEHLRFVIQQLEYEVAERKRAEEQLQKSGELLRQLAAYQEQVKEDERKRIAREIHDELGQNLMALRIDLSLLHMRTAGVHPLLNEKVRFVLSHLDMSIKAVRAIINNLRPSVLDLGLYAAIEWQVKEFERRTGIKCHLVIDDNSADRDLDDQRATAFFRILQESLTNVARHAQATVVDIELRRVGSKFSMTVADNGVGIFPGCRRKPNSFGLLGIGERVNMLGGEFTVGGAPGEGTVLRICIPIGVAVLEI